MHPARQLAGCTGSRFQKPDSDDVSRSFFRERDALLIMAQGRKSMAASRAPRGWTLFRLVFLLAGLSLMGACTLIERVVEIPAQAVRSLFSAVDLGKSVDPVALQDDLLQFADIFITTTTQAIEQVKQADGSPISQFDQARLKGRLTMDMLSLVSGSNQVGNLVEMIVYVGSVRITLQDYWLPSTNGFEEMPLLNVIKEREASLQELAGDVLTREQLAQLKIAIEDWRKSRKPTDFNFGTFASISLVNDVIANTESKSTQSSNNIFALLDLDPLAGLDPATRELTETRLFGERALFMGKRMPQLMEYQMEVLSTRTLDNPELKSVVSSASRMATAADRINQTVAAFPMQVDAEREKLMRDIRSEQQGLTELSRQVEKVLGESTRTAVAADKTLTTFRQIVEQLHQPPRNPGSHPFDIRDYIEAAEKVEAMSLRITDLLRELQLDLDRVDTLKLTQLTKAVTQETQNRTEAVVDYAYRKGLLFVLFGSLIFSGCLLLAGLTYKYLAQKIQRA